MYISQNKNMKFINKNKQKTKKSLFNLYNTKNNMLQHCQGRRHRILH